MNTIFKSIKRLRKLPRAWKGALILPINKKEPKHQNLVSNYRPISFFDIASKVSLPLIWSRVREKQISADKHAFVSVAPPLCDE